jgi:hypothetical protein
MNRHPHRRSGRTARKHKTLVRDLQTIQAEGDGVYELSLFVPEEVPALLRAASAGDPTAQGRIGLIERMIDQISAYDSPAGDDTPLCLLCDTVFWRDELAQVFVVMHAHHDTPKDSGGERHLSAVPRRAPAYDDVESRGG